MSTHERSEMEWTTFEVSSVILYASHVRTKCSQYEFTKKGWKGKVKDEDAHNKRKSKTKEKKKTGEITVFYLHSTFV